MCKSTHFTKTSACKRFDLVGIGGRVTEVDGSTDEPVQKRIDLLSANVLSLVDRFCYMAPFNCRTTLEAKVSAEHRRANYRNIKSIFESDDANEQFRDSWIDWVRANPPPDAATGEEGRPQLLQDIYGSGDSSEDDQTSSGQGKRVVDSGSNLAAVAKRSGAGLADNDFLPEGAAPSRSDEDNPRAAAEGDARLTAELVASPSSKKRKAGAEGEARLTAGDAASPSSKKRKAAGPAVAGAADA